MIETTPLKAPFPWFGGKSRIASTVWSAFGDVANYVESFAGSAAMLLARPGFDPERHIETINDADGFVANFWRAMTADPEAVAHWADWPVNEADLHARHSWLVNRRERLLWSLGDPDFYDAKIAGWWLWGCCMWIGSGWCSGKGPWKSNGATIYDSRVEPAVGPGCDRKRPHLMTKGKGINRQLPHLGSAGIGINRKRPHLGSGRGINRMGGDAWSHLEPIAERLRRVRVCCGNWERVCGPTPTVIHGLTGVFLDPPYSTEAGRDMDCYAVDSGAVAHDVRRWCEERGNDPLLRL